MFLNKMGLEKKIEIPNEGGENINFISLIVEPIKQKILNMLIDLGFKEDTKNSTREKILSQEEQKTLDKAGNNKDKLFEIITNNLYSENLSSLSCNKIKNIIVIMYIANVSIYESVAKFAFRKIKDRKSLIEIARYSNHGGVRKLAKESLEK